MFGCVAAPNCHIPTRASGGSLVSLPRLVSGPYLPCCASHPPTAWLLPAAAAASAGGTAAAPQETACAPPTAHLQDPHNSCLCQASLTSEPLPPAASSRVCSAVCRRPAGRDAPPPPPSPVQKISCLEDGVCTVSLLHLLHAGMVNGPYVDGCWVRVD